MPKELHAKTKAAIRDHAVIEFPRESCGIVIVTQGAEKYLPCRNSADTPVEHFVIAPEAYARAEEMGEIVGIVHSHPMVAARPSDADRSACEASGVPWYIVHVAKDCVSGLIAADEIYGFEPEGFAAPLIGRSYVAGIHDCYGLVCDWYARERGIVLPNFERRDRWWERGEDLLAENFEAVGFVRATGKQQVGDVPIMQIRSKVMNHTGVYLGDGNFMHHPYNRLSTRDVYGGYWQEVTRMWVRWNGGGK